MHGTSRFNIYDSSRFNWGFNCLYIFMDNTNTFANYNSFNNSFLNIQLF